MKKIVMSILFLMTGPQAWAAAMTTVRSGNWNDTSATTPWTALTGSGSGGVPGASDTVISSHVVTIPDGLALRVGNDQTAGSTTAAYRINLVGKLIIGTVTGSTLTVSGDILLGQTAFNRTADFYPLQLNPGSGLEFDATSAPYSTATYVVGPTQSLSPDAFPAFLGTTALPCTVSSRVGSGTGYFGVRGYNTKVGNLIARNTNFVRIGTGTVTAFEPYLSNSEGYFEASTCTFTSCGRIFTVVGVHSGAIFKLYNSQWQNTPGTHCAELSSAGAIAAGERLIEKCAFDKSLGNPGAGCNLQNFTIKSCLFEQKFANGTFSLGRWSNMENSVVRLAVPADTNTNGNMTDIYWIMDFNSGNPHFLLTATTSKTTYYGIVMEYTGTGGDGDGINLNNSFDHIVKRCLVLPRSADGFQAGGTLATISISNAAVEDVSHNTMMGSPSAEHGIQLNETQKATQGTIKSYKSNIYWDTVARGNHFNTLTAGTPSDNAALPESITNNCAWNASLATSVYPFVGKTNVGTYYNVATTTFTPGASDVNVDPQFVDITRNMSKWSLSLGGAQTTAAAMIILRQDLETNIAKLLAYVRGGFAPTNPLLRYAAHDGLTIGAVEWVAASSSNSGAATCCE